MKNFPGTSSIIVILTLLIAYADNAHAQTCSPAPIGLVSWWSGDDNALDARFRNNGSVQSGAGFAAGHVGQAFNFTALDQRVEIPDDASLDLTNAVTLEAWVAPSQSGELSNATTLISKSSLTALNDQPYGIVYGSGGGVLMRVGNNSTLDQTLLTPALPLNVFSHVVGTYDGTTIRIYVNGVEINSKATTIGAMVNNSLTVKIGNNNRAGYVGRIDEPAIYNRALSASEIAAIHAAGTAGKCKPTAAVAPSGLVGWWAGDGDANDVSGNGFNGTLQNGATFAVGQAGQAFSLDGVDDFVDIGRFNLNAYTLETWVFVDQATNGGNQRVISKDNQNLAGTQKVINLLSSCGSSSPANNGKPCAGVRVGGSANGVFSPFVLTTGWHHLATLRDTSAGRLELYVDGVLVASTTPTVLGPVDSAVNAVIGRVSPTSPSEPFLGLVDEASIYDRALSAAEIASIFNAGIGGKLKQATTPTGFALSEPAARAGVSIADCGLRIADFECAKLQSPIQDPKPEIGRPVTTGGTDLANTYGTDFAPDVVNTTIGDATITFQTVTTAGATQQIPLNIASFPPLPEGTHTGLAYDIATSAAFTGNPSVCFNVPSFTATQFANLRVMHFVSGNWAEVTASSNTFPSLCTVPLTSLSPFAVAIVGPTAAGVNVSGRVATAGGYGIPRVRVSLGNTTGGELRTVYTNLFGYYNFVNVGSGQIYIVSVAAKRYEFKNSTQVILVQDEISDLDFIALP